MKQYRVYSRYLRSLVQEAIGEQPGNELAALIGRALDGQPISELHKLVPIDQIRDAGAFFTGSLLAQSVLKHFLATIDLDSVIYDPACGVGDLLLACASKLLLYDDIGRNISSLENRLMGRDLHDEFIDAAKSRLILSAILSADSIEQERAIQVENRFPDIQTGCGLKDVTPFLRATHIVTNPPFTHVPKPNDCQWWGRGKVNQAAVFLAMCVDKCQSGARIIAILPDVLRSGPMYQKWREYISSKAQVSNVNLHGRFGRSAEIDVFSIELVVGNGNYRDSIDWGYPEDGDQNKIEEYFEIRIGPVVDFRHPLEGEEHPFIQVSGLPSWKEVTKIETKRKFTGRFFDTPFVVVRRNSRKDDTYRAVGTIINNDSPVAVENHLIVLRPKDGSIESCRKLLDNLKNYRTKTWFDKRVCCRHLTISALKDLPWWD
jgi:hypothetical protein